MSVNFTVGTIIQGLVVLNNPTYVFERWHGTLLVWAISCICLIFNTSLAKRLPTVESVILTLHMIGLFAIIIPLWILSSPRASAHQALLTFNNNGGWPSTGLASMIGLLTIIYSNTGFDCAVHMCTFFIPLRSLNLASVDQNDRGSGPRGSHRVYGADSRSFGWKHAWTNVDYSGRNRGRRQSPPPIDHVFCLSELRDGPHHGNYCVLLPW